MESVFIVILNWKRKSDTLECLKSIQKLSVDGFELNIIVVDNGSSDGSVDAFKKFKSKYPLQIIENDKNLGFAGGNNVGIRRALEEKASYVVILNNDTILDKRLITELFGFAEKRKDGGAFSPMIYFAKGFEFHKDRYKKSELGKVIWAAGGTIDWANVYGQNRGVDIVDHGQFNKKYPIDFGSGACVMYRAEALEKAGLFDERYFMYYEDVELAMRMAKKHWKSYFVPKAKLWHKVSQSSGIGGELNDYFISRNRLLFGMQYASLRTRTALFREAIRLFFTGRRWQRVGVADYFFTNLYKGSWK